MRLRRDLRIVAWILLRDQCAPSTRGLKKGRFEAGARSVLEADPRPEPSPQIADSRDIWNPRPISRCALFCSSATCTRLALRRLRQGRHFLSLIPPSSSATGTLQRRLYPREALLVRSLEPTHSTSAPCHSLRTFLSVRPGRMGCAAASRSQEAAELRDTFFAARHAPRVTLLAPAVARIG